MRYGTGSSMRVAGLASLIVTVLGALIVPVAAATGASSLQETSSGAGPRLAQIDPSRPMPPPDRQGAGDADWSALAGVAAKGFTVDGSPYQWFFNARRRIEPGDARPAWRFSLLGYRTREIDGNEVFESHGWNLTLPPNSVRTPEELKPVRIDATLGGFGSIDMTLRDSGRLRRARFRCPHTRELLLRHAYRSGTWNGSLTFDVPLDDPDIPDVIDISEVDGGAWRTRYSDAKCPSNTWCSGPRSVSATETSGDTTDSVLAGQGGPYGTLSIRRSVEASDHEAHHLISVDARGALSFEGPTVTMDPTILLPGITSGSMSWTMGPRKKGATDRCRRIRAEVFDGSGSVTVEWDGGAQMISAPATGRYVNEIRR